MEAIEEIIMTNFYYDYSRLTNGTFNKAVCVIGIGHDNSGNIFRDDPQMFLINGKASFLFNEIQFLLDKFKDTFLLGIELAFIDEIRLEEGVRRVYQIFNNQIIRCL